LAVTVYSFAEVGLWLYDLVRGTLTRATSDSEMNFPAWAPGGERLVFGWLKGGHQSIASLRTDGRATPEALVASRGTTPCSWLPDGRQFSVIDSGRQIRIATIVESGKAVLGPPVEAATLANSAEFSPNGRWLAYDARDSGQPEVYVQPYPGPGPRIQVSRDGGVNPAWNRNGHELFYLTEAVGLPFKEERRMMVVDVRETPSLALGSPQQLFVFDERKFPTFRCGPTRCYDVAPDGQRFFGAQHQEFPAAPAVTHISVITNWLDELKQKVPTKAPVTN
jgi:Tol biopolymer transport system component